MPDSCSPSRYLLFGVVLSCGLAITFFGLWVSTLRGSRRATPRAVETPLPDQSRRIAFLVTGHVRQARLENSELRALQQIIQRRFGSCAVFGILPQNLEMSTATWYSSTHAAGSVQQDSVASLCDFTTLQFYDDGDLFSELDGKWGETNIDKRGVRSMWWAINRSFEAAVEGGYNWFIRLRPDNYKWGLQYVEQLKLFLETFPFDIRSQGIVACPPTDLADDVCFAAPNASLALILTSLAVQFGYWSSQVTKHPEFVLPEICKQQGLPYTRWSGTSSC